MKIIGRRHEPDGRLTDTLIAEVSRAEWDLWCDIAGASKGGESILTPERASAFGFLQAAVSAAADAMGAKLVPKSWPAGGLRVCPACFPGRTLKEDERLSICNDHLTDPEWQAAPGELETIMPVPSGVTHGEDGSP